MTVDIHTPRVPVSISRIVPMAPAPPHIIPYRVRFLSNNSKLQKTII